MKELRIPLSIEDISDLKIGDIVNLTGDIWTCRSGVCKRIVDEKQPFPLDSNINNVLLHSGPIVKVEAENQYKLKAISITTGVRFNKWEPEIIEKLNMRAIISKGRVGKETKEAMKKFGCIHLSRTGTFAGAFALKVNKIKSVDWLDLGIPEALWLFEFNNFGPFIVETDIYGNSYYDQINKELESRIPLIYRRLGIENYQYSEK
ncbi:MAG: hypothetical protein JM58_00975 [Peptococcaceae bacterium BICA1-8]|nr:MAG: hypothetical protein JM58_00975 [Peptococcaceae bacterium BICA1-8]